MKASFVIPTFKELKQIEKLMISFSNIISNQIEIVIVNSNPNDETSRFLNSFADKRVREIEGVSTLYWSGAVNFGLNYVLNSMDKPDYVFIMNADVEFKEDILEKFLQKANGMPKFQFAAVTVSGDNIVASGAKVSSWFLTNIRHPLAGSKKKDLAKDDLIEVDYLPTRCVIFPYSALVECGVIAEKQLPHYGGDEEFTNRLRLKGYQPYIYTGVSVFLDSSNTGTDVFHKPLSFRKRLFSSFSIKSPSNPKYRIAFVKMVYPWYAVPSGIILYVFRTFLEVVLGGNLIKKITKKSETGFSGS
jgi:GT2 family glycosyltransferase